MQNNNPAFEGISSTAAGSKAGLISRISEESYEGNDNEEVKNQDYQHLYPYTMSSGYVFVFGLNLQNILIQL